VRITSNGQITIPVGIRERTGLLPQTVVAFEMDREVVRIVRVKDRSGQRRGARASLI
jgi:bifunctional DNA-binding transcriptional regulator/antitoxin component of YhaV-PrlF toxin-antitoxin module